MNEMTPTISMPIGRKDGSKCAAQHFGAWAIEPKWFKAAMDSIRAGTWKPVAFDFDDDDDDSVDDDPGYAVKNGIAIICIDGQMTKRGSSFGGCSTIEVRSTLRTAAADWQVRAIVLQMCSPGGTVAGTSDLAEDVLAVQQGKFGKAKPVFAYVSDMACSAAYWIASQCATIYANTTAMVGCIGTYTVLEDDTGLQEQIGVKYTVVSTGEYKGLGADGDVSDKLVADVQREVNELNQPFLAAVSAGRGEKITDLAAVADGRAYVSAQAKQLGLIDEIASLDAAIEAISKRSDIMSPTEQVKQIAAEHPEAVADYRDQGKTAGIAEGKKAEQERSKAIIEACGDNHALAAEAIVAGLDPSAVKVAAKNAADLKTKAVADAKAASDALAKKDEEIQQLKDKLNFVEGTQGAVKTRGGDASRAAPQTDAAAVEAKAKEAWSKNTDGCRDSFVDEKTYIDTMKAEARVK